MKRLAIIAILLTSLLSIQASNPIGKINQDNDQQVKVVSMNKALFLKEVFDYEKSQTWDFIGKKPVIIDLYASWCAPCRKIAPIMEELAKEYKDQIKIYKVNVDKEKELAGLFNATSIPLLVFIPLKGDPQFIRGAADKATYKRGIDEFLLK